MDRPYANLCIVRRTPPKAMIERFDFDYCSILYIVIMALYLGSVRIVVSTTGCGPVNLGSIPRRCSLTFLFFLGENFLTKKKMENGDKRHAQLST